MTTTFDPSVPQHLQVRVYYEDTDAEGIVYYANYLRFAERGRTEFLRAMDYDHHKVNTAHNLVLVVRHIDIDYLASAKLDDLLDIATEVVDFRNSSLTMRQVISRASHVLVEMEVVVVAVGVSGRAVRLPPQLRQIFGGKFQALTSDDSLNP
jgi:acyl-CoA thioester hydrolase